MVNPIEEKEVQKTPKEKNMIKYALVIFYPNKGIGLTSKTWKDGISDIKQAEAMRTSFLKDCIYDPLNVQVIQYRAS